MGQLINTSGLSGTPIYSSSLSSLISTSGTSIEVSKEAISKFLENDTEIMDIVKKYLVDYLDKFMENPDELLIKDLIKEKDEEIIKLREEIELLKIEIRQISSDLRRLELYNTPLTTTYPSSRGYVPDDTLPKLEDIIYTSTTEINNDNH